MADSSWKRDIARGLIVLVPLVITLYIVGYVYNAIANLWFLEPIKEPVVRVLLTVFVFSALVVTLGYLMRTASGPLIERTIDELMNQLPGIRVVYNASKMAVETAVSGTDELQKPVKLETWDGLRMTAFKTGKTTDDGRDVLFLPTAPNITTGFVVEVDPEAYTETDESVEDALTRILSAGFGETGEGGIPINVVDESDGDERPARMSND